MMMMINEHYQNDETIRAELLKTLEYYFSSKNLSKDEYLVSRMDEQSYVSVDEIAKFNKIKALTSDKELIKEIIEQSSQLELDNETASKVRSINGKQGGSYQAKSAKPTASQTQQQQRSVLILREVAPDADMQSIMSLFENKEPVCAPCEKCESAGNESWYVTFSNEEQAQRALQYLKTEVQVFMDRPIKARIKAHAMPRSNTSGFVGAAFTPTSTPPPQPAHANSPATVASPQPNTSIMQPAMYAPAIAFIPGSQSPMVLQTAANQPAYELPIYPAANWPIPINAPIQNGLFLIDVNQPFQPPIEMDNKQESLALNSSSNSSQSSINQNSPKPTFLIKQQQQQHQQQHSLQQPVYNGPFIPAQGHTIAQQLANQHHHNHPHFNHQYMAQTNPTHTQSYPAHIFDETKNHAQLIHAPIQLHQTAQQQTAAQAYTFFYNPMHAPVSGQLANQTALFNPVMANQMSTSTSSQMQSSSTSSSSSSPKPNQQQQQQFQRQRADVKVANIHTPPKYTSAPKAKITHNNARPHYHNNNNHYQHHQLESSNLVTPQAHAPISNPLHRHDLVDEAKRTNPSLVINSDSSFPPLNSTPPTKNITISLQNLPPKKTADEANETPNDPAIISCFKSADHIPNSPTIIKSNTIIDSKSHDSKKATSETLANILNHEHKSDKTAHVYHQRKYDSYQRNNRNSLNRPARKHDHTRYMRSSNSNHSIHSDNHQTEHKRRPYHHERITAPPANENYANYAINNHTVAINYNHDDDDDSLANCWNKKLTFAEIVQKSGSTSPSPTKSSNDSESIAPEAHSPHTIPAE